VIFGLGVDARFKRGDANFDGVVNISDAIFNLTYLFLGGTGPPCEDAADADDNGKIEITDAVRILNHLFLGTAVLPAPYPAEGEDTTADPLTCPGF
jgi:dockerin type I repeat protein